jgi:hypothetical protein
VNAANCSSHISFVSARGSINVSASMSQGLSSSIKILTPRPATGDPANGSGGLCVCPTGVQVRVKDQTGSAAERYKRACPTHPKRGPPVCNRRTLRQCADTTIRQIEPAIHQPGITSSPHDSHAPGYLASRSTVAASRSLPAYATEYLQSARIGTSPITRTASLLCRAVDLALLCPRL